MIATIPCGGCLKALAAERAVQREAESADVAGLPQLGCSVNFQALSDQFHRRIRLDATTLSIIQIKYM